MQTGRSTSNTEVMGEKFGELKKEYAEKIREEGNDNLADVIEGSTPSQITSDGFIQGQKISFPEFKEILQEYKESVKKLQSNGEEAYNPMDYFTSPDSDNKNPKFVANKLAKDIEADYEFRYIEDSEQLFVYDHNEGYFQDRGENLIRTECNRRLRDHVSRRRITEVKGIVEDRAMTMRHEFRPPRRKINLENGVYDLEEEKLIDHSPEYNFSHKISIEYPENPPGCEEIDGFLNSIVESEEDVKTLKEIAGYLLLPDYPINKSFILIGQGKNGKSRYIDLLKNLLGERNYTNKSLQELENNRFATSNLYGKLACFDDDLPSVKLGGDNRVKTLTGGSDVGAEIKYGGDFDFKNYAKLLFAANEMPQTSDNSDGFYRRWIILNFPYKFKTNPDPENDYHRQATPERELMHKITTEEELQGFIWSIIEDLKDVIENDEFTYARNPGQVRKKWREHSVPIVRFIEKYVKQGTTYTESKPEGDSEDGINAYNYDYIRKDTLHALIGWYCKERSHSVPSKKAIKRELDETDLLFGVKRTRREPEDKRIPVYSGLRLELDEGVDGCPGLFSYLTRGEKNIPYKGSSKQSMDTRTPTDVADPSPIESSKNPSRQQVAVRTFVEGFPEDEVETQTIINCLNYDEGVVEDAISNLLRDGELWEPKTGYVRLI